MELPRQEYWSELSVLSPGDLPDPAIEPTSPALAGRYSTKVCSQIIFIHINAILLLKVCVCVCVCVCVWLISDLIALWSEKMFDGISVFLNLPRFTLQPSMWSVLENVPCGLEAKLYSAAFGWSTL